MPRHLADEYEDDPQVHDGEFWAKGPIPLGEVTRVWEFTPQVDGDLINRLAHLRQVLILHA